MANIFHTVNNNTVPSFPSDGVTKTALLLKAAGGTALNLHQLWLSFDGTVVSAIPVLVEIYRPSSDGTSTGTPNKSEVDEAAAALAATIAETFTAEPTTGANGILMAKYLPTFGGNHHIILPSAHKIVVAAAARLAIRITNSSNNTIAVSCRVGVLIEE